MFCEVNLEPLREFLMLEAMLGSKPKLPDPMNVWKQKTSGGYWTLDNSMTVMDGYLYCIWGAKANTGTYINTLYRYDPSRDVWLTLPNAPIARTLGQLVGYAGKLYLFGGIGPGNYIDLYVFDIASSTWTTKAGSVPKQIYYAGAVVVGGFMYVLGGFDNAGFNRAIMRYEFATNTWLHTLAPDTIDRLDFGTAVIGRKIYLYGAYNAADLAKTFEVYDIDSNTWSTIVSPYGMRAGHRMCAINGKLYIFGGANGQVQALPAFLCYDPVANTWTELDSPPDLVVQRYAMATYDGKMYVYGGTGIPASVQTQTLWSYTP